MPFLAQGIIAPPMPPLSPDACGEGTYYSKPGDYSATGACLPCKGKLVCSVPDMWIYGAIAILALMMLKR